MVNDRLLQMARHELGSAPLRILVTGGTGFIGSRLAKLLLAAGHHVIVCGRNHYRYPLLSPDARIAECDLADRGAVIDLCTGCDLVYHIGAMSTPWGSRPDFIRSNVDGTRNVVDGCLEHHVPRLVHVSSTAIFFEYSDKLGIRDDSILPTTFCCEYAESKAEAESLIQSAVARGLNAIMIRARAVFGPGDNALLPRLIHAARQGRLRQIGHGTNILDMTYVDNLIASLLLAARRGAPGNVCTVTNEEPVLLWPLLKDALNELKIASNLRTVPRSAAMAVATLLEWKHRLLKLSGEPIMTRYAVGLLSRSQTFDPSHARKVLNYAPLVSMKDGIRMTLENMAARDESAAATSVKLRMFSTGYTAHRASLAEHGAPRNQMIRFHAMFAVLEHPTRGITLFDTGYSPRFFTATDRLPYKLYRWTTRVETCEELSAVAVLKRHGIAPDRVQRIVLSHFHADHVCGLLDFPNADIITSARAWTSIQGKKGLAAVSQAILPDLFPANLTKRLRLIENLHDPGFGPFQSTHDLFGDGSVRMIALSGHALGQIGLLLQRTSEDPAPIPAAEVPNLADAGSRCLLAADAAWTSRTIREKLPYTWGFRMLAASAREADETCQTLNRFCQMFPDIELIPTHCPEVAERHGFDAHVDELLAARRTSQFSRRTV